MMKTAYSPANRARLSRYCSVVVAILAFFEFSLPAVPPPSGPAPLASPAGGFHIEGDLVSGTPLPGVGDWLPGASTSPASVLNSAGAPLNPAFTFHFNDAFGNSSAELIFAGGLKWTDNPNQWGWTSGKPSSKTDINNVLLHISEDSAGHIWTVLSADRASTSGDSYIDFELLQNPLFRTNGGAFVSQGPHGGRTVNDLLLSLAFTGGGKTADFFAWRWQPDGLGGYAYVDATASLPVGKVYVALNSNSIPVPYGAFGASTYAPNAFAEAAIDLTALLGNFDPCLSYGFKTIMVKTKASSSSSAGIEDFIDPIQYSLRIGPGADAGTDQTRCDEGDSTSFALQGKANAGLGAIGSTAWSVIDGDVAIESPNSLNTTARVSSQKATLRLTVIQANGCTATDDLTLAVSPLPSCIISGPEFVCPESITQFRGLPGQTYAWSISGAGAIVGPATQAVVNVASGPCGEEFVLSLAVVSNACSSTCSFRSVIQDTNPPSLSAPPDIVLECPSGGGTNVAGTAMASDECGRLTLTFSDSVTNLCGNSRVIGRTWTATDLCGNTSSKQQIITVRDTIKPVLICPANVTLECPSDTGTNVTGVASATDACGAVSISFADIVTVDCGGTKVTARTWTAIDECGNASSATQTITLRDTTPPALDVPPSITLECPSDGGTNVAGVALSSDGCGTVTVSFSDVVSTNCGGTKVIARTWTSVDQCGNSTNKVQTVTIRDTQPPGLICPPNLVLQCPADTSTNATGTAMAQDLCGAVVISFKDARTNNCGLADAIVRTWTATDQCGNTTNAVQLITVRDTRPPTLVLPPDLFVECPGITTTNATGVATANDSCGSVTISFSDVVTNLCANTKIIARTWVAADQCGNSAQAVQRITVRDLTPPSLIIPPDITLECPSSGGTNETGVAMAGDLCSTATVRFADSVQTLCGGTKVISRAWIAEDGCGNTTNRLQKITVRDTRPPSLVLPLDRIVECGNSTEPLSTGSATGSDACGAVTVRYSDAVTNACGGTKMIARTWTITDSCGNATNGVQKISVRDTTPPALKLPADVVMQCPGDTRTSATGLAIAQDACGTPLVTYTDVITNGCGATKTVLRTWTAIDQCGNATNGLQTIAVVDTQKPSVTCPSVNVQCVADIPAPYTDLTSFLAAGGKATDTCDAALSFTLVSDSGLVGSCPGTVTRVYRVVDACANYTDATQRIVVRDTVKPVITCPPAITLSCGEDIRDLTKAGLGTAMDNCDTNVNVTFTDNRVDSSYSIKWYASDPNTDKAPYLPSYLKLPPAAVACPSDALTSGRAADPLIHAVAYAPGADQLDALTSLGGEPMHFGQIVPFQVVIGLDGGPGPEKGTLEFMGGWSTHTTSNDEFGYDKNYMVYCAFVDFADPGTIDPHRNARVESYRAELYEAGTINEQIRGTFRVSGLDVGDRVVVEIWVVLKSAPSRNVGGTIASELVAAWKPLDPPVPLASGNQTVSIGNLSKITPMPSPQPVQPPQPPLPPQPPIPLGRLISVTDRAWTATDDCGNSSTCVQRISVVDSTAPLLVAPADLTLEVPGDTSTNLTGVATASDACGTVLISYSDSVVTNCGMSRVVTRTWSASDGANTTNAVQTISVVDTTPPQFASASEPILVPSEQNWSFPQPLASDECGPVTIRILNTTTNIVDGVACVTRTWEAEDPCGNTARTSRTINVHTAPEISLSPASRIVRCGDSASLTVGATGSGPLSYQWRLNGVDIPGATDFSLQIGSGFGTAGVYSVSVSNAAGVIVSPVAIVNVAPVLGVESSSQGLKISWPSGFVLQYAGEPVGPYIDVPAAASPYLYSPSLGTKKFFRLRPESFRVSTASLPGGATSVSVSGAPGCTMVLQASNDGASWINLTTNTAPCTYVDGNAAASRIYRAVPLQLPGSPVPPNPPVLNKEPANATVPASGTATLKAEFTSAGSLLYQWQRNGRDIPGATASSFTLTNAHYSDAALYRVIAGNGGGSVISAPAVVNVAPRLAMASANGSVTVSWDGTFSLESSQSLNGPFADVSPQPAGNSLTTSSSAPQRYFRLRTRPFNATLQPGVNGALKVNVTGSPGCNFVLQTSTNLTSWINAHTNTAPCTFTQTNASGRMIWFRAVPLN